eukprot:TRINITY_DN112620_c0_g1_i1.p1 TRINITY_DN112620_c0_g1~~TRINITY_DN112620_c0_g1_i1.p1  ORF type:complete len:330 (+),score=82.74 TRINITY_DN112620_c0_g1_i1:71-991(+)
MAPHTDERMLQRRLLRAIGVVTAGCAFLGISPASWLCGGRVSAGHAAASAQLQLRGSPLAAVAADVAQVKTEIRGEEGTESFRRFFLEDGKEISPWHDLPLETGTPGEYWMVTEIPKNTKPKMEIATKEPFNPISQDTKKGKLRDYHGPIFWNYGYLPQTWEDPTLEHPELRVLGDNDPVDVVEIGSRTHEQGEIGRIKVLGALAMIDSGELDWKIIAISSADPLAAELSDIADVESKLPGVVSGIREWFRWYKTPDGKPLNEFGFQEAALDKKASLEIIEETHGAWKRFRNGEAESKLWQAAAAR